ncbi:MAG: RHS repeat-associated core domain-containing protein [Chryseobacterium sp.]|uniref:DUF6443 domain-containing protein n=1 Tax=Chryseobacterium sp. TaxID=1871047 RepID=UPI0025C05F59|nr:DUF6443 domain-containing protein [Chryseobacterium sp.]MCJ7933282.1 RHS repeat-associated core domain-containing protein [Chryseobacterium sp.]
MKKISLIVYFFVSALFYAQSLTNTENYTYSRTYLEPVTTEQPGAQQRQTVQYFDGLGRNTQNIGIKASPLGKDIVIPVAYDKLGRVSKNYLPLPIDSRNGAYIPNAGENAVNAYYNVPNAFSEVAYENSPLGRIEKAAAPGSEWQLSGNHISKAEYLSNTANEVKRFRAAITWNSSLQLNDVVLNFAANDAYTTNGYYNANILYKSVSKDEDGNESHSFTNSLGQTILVRKINVKENGAVENLDTYYVYDDFGNLSFMIPPKAAIASTGAEIQPLLNPLCYQYKYDKYNRLAEKKLPGKGWEYFVYDKQNRQVLGQDANLRTSVNSFGKPGWMFTKYDAFGRIVYSGFFANTASRIAMQTALNNMSANAVNNETVSASPFTQNNINFYYTKEAFPTGSMTILSVNYYDEYPEGAPQRPDQIQNQPVLASASTLITSNGLASVRSTKALPTISYTKNIENDNWSSDAIWYDQLGRAIGSYSKNHLGGFTKTEALLDFSGKTQLAFTYHSKNTINTEVTVKDTYTYSPQGYLLKHYQQVDSGMEELLSNYTYNDLGQVINKKVGNNLQSIDYTYNIRGWLTGINAADINNMGSKLFSYKIKYNTVEGAEVPNSSFGNLKVKPKYNGSIVEVDWKTAYGTNEPLRRYGYVYDGSERLRAGFFQVDTNPYSREYSEVIDYDLGGNITSLHRTGSAVNGVAEVIDNLTYNYLNNSNQLDYVQESGKGNALSGYPLPAGKGASLQYDANGNITQHLDKGLAKITYNFLNLPSQITPNSTTGLIKYIYASDGTKLQMNNDLTVTDYLGGFQYTANATGGMQSFVLANEEGYYDFVNNRYVYQYVDHLGNIRVSYAKGSSEPPVILEENNYYPFGLKHTGYNTGDTTNNKFKYLYNGKELQSSGNLDYGWRQYMPDLGRWIGMDQLSESYSSDSPYAYVLNNPVNMYDPDGRVSVDWAMSFYNNSQDGYNTNWTNTGSGFVSNWGGSMSYEGTPTNFSFGGTSTGIGNGPDGGIFIQIPAIELQTKSSFFWGLQIQSHVNKYMEWWNAKSDFAWDRVRNAGRYSDKGGVQSVNILAVPYMLLEAVLTEGLMQAGMEGHSAHSTAQVATFLYAMKAPQGVSGEMGIINKKGGTRIDPVNLPKSVTNDFTEILAGRGIPRMTGNAQTILENRSGVSLKWVGAKEWKIADVPDTSLNGSRILQHPSGKWGLVIDHNYKNIIQIPTSSAVKWK